MPYEFTRFARADLEAIVEYTRIRHGRKQAVRYVAKLENCAENLAKKFGSYKVLDGIHLRLMVMHCQHHYLFGLEKRGCPMAIIAIYHERMDVLNRIKGRLR